MYSVNNIYVTISHTFPYLKNIQCTGYLLRLPLITLRWQQVLYIKNKQLYPLLAPRLGCSVVGGGTINDIKWALMLLGVTVCVWLGKLVSTQCNNFQLFEIIKNVCNFLNVFQLQMSVLYFVQLGRYIW